MDSISTSKDFDKKSGLKGESRSEGNIIKDEATASKKKPDRIMPQFALEELFPMHAKFGESRNSGDTISLKNMEKWFKQAKVKQMTLQDPTLHFTRIAKGRKSISYKEFLVVLEKMANEKQMALEELKVKLCASGPPLPNNPTKFGSSGVYDRLTDKTKFTGVHKNKFDELGRGKSKPCAFTGYVTGYKMADSYNKTH